MPPNGAGSGRRDFSARNFGGCPTLAKGRIAALVTLLLVPLSLPAHVGPRCCTAETTPPTHPSRCQSTLTALAAAREAFPPTRPRRRGQTAGRAGGRANARTAHSPPRRAGIGVCCPWVHSLAADVALLLKHLPLPTRIGRQFRSSGSIPARPPLSLPAHAGPRCCTAETTPPTRPYCRRRSMSCKLQAFFDSSAPVCETWWEAAGNSRSMKMLSHRKGGDANGW